MVTTDRCMDRMDNGSTTDRRMYRIDNGSLTVRCMDRMDNGSSTDHRMDRMDNGSSTDRRIVIRCWNMRELLEVMEEEFAVFHWCLNFPDSNLVGNSDVVTTKKLCNNLEWIIPFIHILYHML
ncbi:hypothetical protein CEXT_401101 [Caerostris extrusa]|uniref:Uncharacterized protein n=1 Tax=Caerostris extrusa TaxID=172846 RepID=A0AAV4QDP7_CAEEX|nr:hypothetical protein CEXT_401101 [Caerostris extrusa]